MNDPTIWRTPGVECPACQAGRRHTPEDLALHHHYSGHGYDRKHWSHPALEKEAGRCKWCGKPFINCDCAPNKAEKTS